jgi:hypothetical protein
MTKRQRRRRGEDGFVEVRRNGRLLFRYDPNRDLVEIKPKGSPSQIVDLRQFRTPVRNQS